MSNTTLNFGTSLTLEQAAQIIMATPTNRYFLQGEPGIGKSSLLDMVGKRTKMPCAYIDMSTMDLGDACMPSPNRELKVTEYFPNQRFLFHTGEPVVVMLDEFTKAPLPVQNMFHPLLESKAPRFGDIFVNDKSIIFLTGNLSSDGVGDNLKAHTRNRVIVLHIKKPSAEQWLGWAINNNIDPVILAWVDRFPHVMASYLDPGQEDNHYIFNPKKFQLAFVSPRSLERASNITRAREHFDQDTLIASLSGTLGEAGSRDLQAFIAYQDQLPKWEKILDDPDGVKVPSSPGACAVLVYGAITRITKANITAFMKYLERFDPEWQAAFAITVAKNPSKQSVAFSSSAFQKWIVKNQDIV